MERRWIHCPVPLAKPETMLPQAGAVVIGREDVGGDEELIETMAHQTRILAVTEAEAGAVLYWNGDRRRFHHTPKSRRWMQPAREISLQPPSSFVCTSAQSMGNHAICRPAFGTDP